ncbi:hypothetical protein IWZ01DRAFT_119276 [Phyllosticta capitalensis]
MLFEFSRLCSPCCVWCLAPRCWLLFRGITACLVAIRRVLLPVLYPLHLTTCRLELVSGWQLRVRVMMGAFSVLLNTAAVAAAAGRRGKQWILLEWIDFLFFPFLIFLI